jgi:uncharacterized repeat protein (TIGR04076 family)
MKKPSPLKFTIKQLRLSGERKCPWHRRYKKGKIFFFQEIFPQGICPWLYNSVYPYFLGLFYGARFSWNKQGDCNVCCPAAKGVDVIVRLRPNDGTFDPRISSSMKFVIFAEVISLSGECPYRHKVGQKIPFPTSMAEHFLCPAAFHNIFPLMQVKPPACIEINKLRCPDWNDVIYLGI